MNKPEIITHTDSESGFLMVTGGLTTQHRGILTEMRSNQELTTQKTLNHTCNRLNLVTLKTMYPEI